MEDADSSPSAGAAAGGLAQFVAHKDGLQRDGGLGALMGDDFRV